LCLGGSGGRGESKKRVGRGFHGWGRGRHLTQRVKGKSRRDKKKKLA